MFCAVLLNGLYSYACKLRHEALLHAAGYHPWGVNPFLVRIVTGHSLALVPPPSISGIVISSLMTLGAVISIICIIRLVRLKARLPIGFAILMLLVIVASFIYLLNYYNSITYPP